MEAVYVKTSNLLGPLKGIPLSGCLGDQQSALVGQQCLSRGQTKATFGTGCFLLYNTGHASVTSTHGLLTTVAYQLGPESQAVYALEGSVAIAGAAITLDIQPHFNFILTHFNPSTLSAGFETT